MILFENKKLLLAFSLIIGSISADDKPNTSIEKTQSWPRHFFGAVTDIISWPFNLPKKTKETCFNQINNAAQKIKDNLPSNRLKKVANEAQEKFNEELRESIKDGSQEANLIVEKLSEKINDNIDHLHETMHDTVEHISTNLHGTVSENYKQLQDTSVIGSILMVRTLCLSACATAGALLLYTNLNNQSGFKSIALAALGATMLGGSGYFAERILKTDTLAKKED